MPALRSTPSTPRGARYVWDVCAANASAKETNTENLRALWTAEQTCRSRIVLGVLPERPRLSGTLDSWSPDPFGRFRPRVVRPPRRRFRRTVRARRRNETFAPHRAPPHAGSPKSGRAGRGNAFDGTIAWRHCPRGQRVLRRLRPGQLSVRRGRPQERGAPKPTPRPRANPTASGSSGLRRLSHELSLPGGPGRRSRITRYHNRGAPGRYRRPRQPPRRTRHHRLGCRRRRGYRKLPRSQIKAPA